MALTVGDHESDGNDMVIADRTSVLRSTEWTAFSMASTMCPRSAQSLAVSHDEHVLSHEAELYELATAPTT